MLSQSDVDSLVSGGGKLALNFDTSVAGEGKVSRTPGAVDKREELAKQIPPAQAAKTGSRPIISTA